MKNTKNKKPLTAEELYESRPFNEIVIQFHRQDKLKGMIDINSDDYPVHFASMFENGHEGLQCSFENDDPRYKKYWDLCHTIITAVREIDKLHSDYSKKQLVEGFLYFHIRNKYPGSFIFKDGILYCINILSNDPKKPYIIENSDIKPDEWVLDNN